MQFMETILKTLANYYIIFILLALIGIFAIVGYFIEKKHPQEKNEGPKLDMEAVAKKGSQGLGATLGQNPVSNDEEVEQLDMTMQPTTFVNTNSSGNDSAATGNNNYNNQNTFNNNASINQSSLSDTGSSANININNNNNSNQNISNNSSDVLGINPTEPTNPGFKSPF